jgi:Uma2 family endonuclease
MNDEFFTPAQSSEGYPDVIQPAVSRPAEAFPKKRRWTREEYYKMAESNILAPDERVELIEGEILQMPPQGPSHSTGIRTVQETLRTVFGHGFDVRPQLPLSLGLASDPEPDIAVVSGSYRDYRSAHPNTALLVVEVSDTTLDFDRHEKASLYARAGVQEYWLINLPKKQVEVHRAPGPIPDMPFGYGYAEITFHKADDTISPLSAPDADIYVADILP